MLLRLEKDAKAKGLAHPPLQAQGIACGLAALCSLSPLARRAMG
jgi:hypothetical protein